MSREEKIINHLFEQARKEQIETSAGDIQKWIGLVTLGTVLTGLLTKIKVVFTKSVVMYSTAILTIGIGLGTFFLYGTGDNPVQQKAPSDIGTMTVSNEKEIQLTNEVLPVAPETPAPEINVPATSAQQEQPVAHSELPSFPFELPLRNPLPIEMPEERSIARISSGDEVYGIFNALKIYGAVDVVISQGEKETVKVEGDEKGKSIVVIKNKNNTLEIYTDNKKNIKDFKVKVYVTLSEFKHLNCSGAVDVSSSGELKADNLGVDISGASDVKLTLNVTNLNLKVTGASDVTLKTTAEKVKADISGASDVTLSGTASDLDLMCSGASDLKAEKLKVKNGKVKCSGASSTKVYITENLDIDATGASSLKYKGTPKIGSKTVSSGAKAGQF